MSECCSIICIHSTYISVLVYLYIICVEHVNFTKNILYILKHLKYVYHIYKYFTKSQGCEYA